jgi:hypothetical protein
MPEVRERGLQRWWRRSRRGFLSRGAPTRVFIEYYSQMACGLESARQKGLHGEYQIGVDAKLPHWCIPGVRISSIFWVLGESTEGFAW